MELTFEEIAAVTGGKTVVKPAGNPLLTSITWDSRDVAPQSCFIALPGERVDGYDFVEAALAAGAMAALVARKPQDSQCVRARNVGAGIIQVDDCAIAIERLARAWRSRLRAQVIGITGSSGKTTTKNFAREVLSRRWRVHATAGNQNNELGVPKTVLDAPLDCQVLILELGISEPGEMTQLCDLTRPTDGLIISIGSSHLEYLKDQRTVAWEKSGLWRSLPSTGRAFVNIDDPWAASCFRFGQLDRGIVYDIFGVEAAGASGVDLAGRSQLMDHAERQVLARDVHLDRWGRAGFLLHVTQAGRDPQDHPVQLSLIGRHNVLDACGAAALGLAWGIPVEHVAQALSDAQPEAGRSQLIEAAGGWRIINDAYNANPSSTHAVLETLGALSGGGRRIAVLGDMGELGVSGPQAHKAIGAQAAACDLDALLCVGELSALTAEAAVAGGMAAEAVHCCEDASEAAKLVKELLAPDDVVLVKASRFVGLDVLVEEIR